MAAKIKDGLFIGDAETSQSEIFINDNKISNLINLSGREVQNVWAPHGLVYLTYYWEDTSDYKIFSSHDDSMLSDIVEFIDVSISHGISVLLFSTNGKSRCIVAACIYLMMKYRWGFEKTFDYVYSKKPDANVNKGFIQQMFSLDMKLLASRQKLFAAKYGSSNITFKIEPNMTIRDISAMLPSDEAKRWNSWDVDYILSSTSEKNNHFKEIEDIESKFTEQKSDYKRSNRTTLRNKQQLDSSVDDDEIVLIYSFLNSKNVISSLPGPYPNIYDTPKTFKLKFNSICYEEDVNWFPPTISRQTPIRSIMKGSRNKSTAANIGYSTGAQPKHVGMKNNANQTLSAKLSSDDFKYDNLEYHDMDNNQMYINNNNQREKDMLRASRDFSVEDLNTSSHPTSFQNSQQLSNDLYEFVGISNLSGMADSTSRRKNDRGTTTWGPRDSINIHKFPEEDTRGVRNTTTQSSAPLSAEDRLRNLMADMQRQKHPSEFTQLDKEQVIPAIGPSLYDLATMKIPGSNNLTGNQQLQLSDYDDDLLYAFNQQVYPQTTSKNNGAVRARHDILTQNNMRSINGGASNSRPGNLSTTSGPRTAWGPNPNSNRTGTPTNSRPASPSVNRQNGPTSISSVNSNASGNSQFAGSGMNSAAKVYRHGSPAPSSRAQTGSNIRQAPNSGKPSYVSKENRAVASTGGDVSSIANSSISSLGSGIAAAGNNNMGNNYPATNSGARYNLDPYLAGSGNRNVRAASPQLASQQRRNPVPSATIDSTDRHRPRVVGNSPLRASYTSSSAVPTAIPPSSNRYTTSTPQSNMHHDYDSTNSATNYNSNGNSSIGSNKRSSTPTKNAWKF